MSTRRPFTLGLLAFSSVALLGSPEGSMAMAYSFEAERFCAQSDRVDGCDEFDDGAVNGRCP